MDGVVEIITGPERRRRWSLQDKVRIVAETNEPGSMIRAVAARHGVCECLLFTWRRQAREGLLGPAPDSPLFVPVQALASASTAVGPLDERPRPELGLHDRDRSDGAISPAVRNQRNPTGGNIPTFIAPSSLERPSATNDQNRRRSADPPATPQRSSW